jgi:phosphoglycerate-specific signal transduction histidine kinase
LTDTIKSLSIEIQAATEEIKSIEARIHVATQVDEKQLIEQSRISQLAIKDIYSQIVTKQAIVSELINKLNENKMLYQQKQKRLSILNAAINEAAANAKKSKVKYILDKHSDLIPFLVELSAKSVRVALADNTNSIFEFEASSYKEEQEMFMTWAKKQSPSMYYFVLLVKPSCLEYEDKETGIGYLLKNEGYEIGFDLLPENANPF